MAPAPDPDNHATPASRVQAPSKTTSPSKPKMPTTADSLLHEDNITSDSPSAELTASVESLLDSLTRKFSSVSAEIFTKMDEMSSRLDALEDMMQTDDVRK